MSYTVAAGKRLAVEQSEWLDGWFTSASPRNGNSNAEGQWCQWVHLARQILAHPLTAETMPEHVLAYDDPPHIYDEHHPDCKRVGPCAESPS